MTPNRELKTLIQSNYLLFQAEEKEEVLVAGDPERKSMKKVDSDGGITYHPNFIKHLVRNSLL